MDGISRRRRQTGDPCDCLRPLIRFWGIFTAIVVCGVGVDVSVHGHTLGTLILIGSMSVLFFEVKWIVTLFVQLLFASDHMSGCVQCWSICKIAGGWRLSPFYIAFGVALIFWPQNLWLSYVAGAQLILLAILRLCLLFRFTNSNKEEGLLPQRDFEKTDAFSDVIDDDIFPEVCHSLEDEEPIDDES